jgi:hypothetical protein
MILVSINGLDRTLQQITSSWINEQIEGRRAAGNSVCVRVIIKIGSLDLALSTPTCPASGGGSRAPNPQEEKILRLWNEKGMNSDHFKTAQLLSFLAEAKRHV